MSCSRISTGILTLIVTLASSVVYGQGELEKAMGQFIGSWKSEKQSGQNFENYRLYAWDLNKQVINFYEFPSPSKKWRVKSVFVLNPVSKQIESQDYTDWGNFVKCRIEPLPNGITRYMTVLNAMDKKEHTWISEWTWVDVDTWQSKAREVDAQGKLVMEGPLQVYHRINGIPTEVIDN